MKIMPLNLMEMPLLWKFLDALPVGIDTRVFMEGKVSISENSDISYIDREKRSSYSVDSQ